MTNIANLGWRRLGENLIGERIITCSDRMSCCFSGIARRPDRKVISGGVWCVLYPRDFCCDVGGRIRLRGQDNSQRSCRGNILDRDFLAAHKAYNGYPDKAGTRVISWSWFPRRSRHGDLPASQRTLLERWQLGLGSRRLVDWAHV